MFQLRDYQKECLEATVERRKAGVNKQLIALSVGAGKTVIFSNLPKYHEDSTPMLVLAHREELLDQARDKILASNPDLKVGIEMAQHHADEDCDVVCASVATIGRSGSKRIEKFAKDHFKVIVIDEAHHAAASTYKNILNYFDFEYLLGVTATPKRSDNIRLDDVFDEIVYEKNMLSLIEEEYLSEPIPYRFTSSVDISDVTVRAGDYAQRELSEAINVDARHAVAVSAHEMVGEKLGREPTTVVFCVDIAHAEACSSYFNSVGIKARAVSSLTENREEILTGFKNGDFNVLVNVGVLVEGYDNPYINCVIMARPTQSKIFYTQAVGRGARLDGLENQFYVIDIADASRGKRPLSILSLMGLPAEFSADGEELSDTVKKFNELKDKSPSQAITVKSLSDIDAAWEKIDLFTPPPVNEALLQYSSMLWMEVGDDYVINIGTEDKIKISQNHLGTFEVLVNDVLVDNQPFLARAFSAADKIIKTTYSDSVKLLDRLSPWREDSPSDKQIKILKRHNVPYEHLSKGEASEIISKIFKENPRKPVPHWVKYKKSKGNF